MFHFLHKCYRAGLWVLAAGFAFWIYQNRLAFTPVVDAVDAARPDEGFSQAQLGVVTGQVVRVLDGDTIRLQVVGGGPLTVRLTGLDAPDIQQTNRAELRRAIESRTNLSQLVLSNLVRVEITYSNMPGNALGIVYLGETNVNAALIASGWAHLRRGLLNGLPFGAQYTLLRADRRAAERKALAAQSPGE